MAVQTDSLLINYITARPEAVHQILCSLHALRQAEQRVTSRELKKLVTLPDVDDNQWDEHVRAAVNLGVIRLAERQLEQVWEFQDVETFKQNIRRRFREFELAGSANSLIAKAYRVALSLPLSGQGTLELAEFVNAVTRATGTRSPSSLRAFNEEKARSWLRWMCYIDIAVGSSRFVPVVATVMRSMIVEGAPARETDMTLREFLSVIEGEVPCAASRVESAASGVLPLATSAALTLLEAEGLLRVSGLADASETWFFPETNRQVTHIRITGGAQ
jgi:hypothetical protein